MLGVTEVNIKKPSTKEGYPLILGFDGYDSHKDRY